MAICLKVWGFFLNQYMLVIFPVKTNSWRNSSYYLRFKQKKKIHSVMNKQAFQNNYFLLAKGHS